MEFLIRKDAPTVPHKKHWQFCVGSGHALLALIVSEPAGVSSTTHQAA